MYVVFSMCKRNLLPFIFGDALCFQFLHIDLVSNVGQYVEMTCLFVCLKHILAVFLGELGIDFRHRTVFEQAGLQLFYLTFAGKTGVASYLPSDYLKNYLKCDCAEQLLALLGVKNRMFGTNVEESYTAGEGALVLDRLYPELVKMLAVKVAAQAEADVSVIVASANTADALEAAGLKCVTLEEAAEADLC